MARVGLCRLNSEGVATVQARFRQGRWTSVAAFCHVIGMRRTTYYELLARRNWFELDTLRDKLTALGIPQEDQARLFEFREVEPAPVPSAPASPNNLPFQPTSFIGREEEKATLKQILASSALLTLTGSGGCGKTRLALEVGQEVLGDFADGVWLVELASLTAPELVGRTLLSALGLREEPGRSFTETAVAHLKPKRLLLILDNCEHLVEACAQLAAALMRACAQVTILATSREPLRVSGEAVWSVPSLLVPDVRLLRSEKAGWSTVLEYDACRLLIERAQGHRADLALNQANALWAAVICERLDGIPLALELAAARVRLLTLEEIAGRLDHRFRLLTGGRRDMLPRHQTLRALIDWSWELLTPEEQCLLGRLSVFAGGWTLEAAEAVCTDKAEGGRRMAEGAESDSSFILHP